MPPVSASESCRYDWNNSISRKSFIYQDCLCHSGIVFDLRVVISVLDSEDTEQADLRGGRSPWYKTNERAIRLDVGEDVKCDALVVGGGITGSLIAERLTRQGLDVIVIDRELPGRGSTAASTSMLLWEIDRSLTQLTEIYGFERALRAYQASLQAVAGLKSLVHQLDISCELRNKPSLYLAAGDTSKQLLGEHQLRERAGLPGEFLDHGMLLDVFGIARAGALVSSGAADADPSQLARGMLKVAVARGARVFEAEAIHFDAAARSVGIQLNNSRQIEARSVILATGYVMPSMIHSTIQTVSSSWAIATKPQPQNIWKGGALIWEDSKDYLYARTTSTGRIIIGGEDSEEVTEPEARDRLIPQKSRVLAQKLAALWPAANLDIEYRWSGTFDTTSDGLPLIGPVPGKKGIFAAYGYGGNGITFSFLAAQLIGDLIAGSSSQLLHDFALDRDGQSTVRN
jgi:glycine/D-amino acid oxidase-like deaminating enzyme